MSLQFNPFTGTFDVTTKGDTGAAGTVTSAGDGTAAAPGITFASDTDSGIYRTGPNALAVSTGGTGRLFIDASGNIGIGQSSVTAVFGRTVSNTGTAAATYRVAGASTSAYLFVSDGLGYGGIFQESNHPFIFGVFSGERARIRADGTFEIKGGGTAGVSPAFSVNPSATSNSLVIDSSGRLLVGTSTNSGGALLQVNGDRIRVGTAKTPASATDIGTAGEICWDANYIYVCTATNTWKRTAIATW